MFLILVFINRYPHKAYYLCDQLAVAGAINPEIILKTSEYYVTVDLQHQDIANRGRTIIDVKQAEGKRPNVIFVEDMDKELLEKMILDTYKCPP
jgi:inosine-uridine nucleoside N-ribohydrolase